MSKTAARLLYDKTLQNQKKDDLENLNGESGTQGLNNKSYTSLYLTFLQHDQI